MRSATGSAGRRVEAQEKAQDHPGVGVDDQCQPGIADGLPVQFVDKADLGRGMVDLDDGQRVVIVRELPDLGAELALYDILAPLQQEFFLERGFLLDVAQRREGDILVSFLLELAVNQYADIGQRLGGFDEPVVTQVVTDDFPYLVLQAGMPAVGADGAQYRLCRSVQPHKRDMPVGGRLADAEFLAKFVQERPAILSRHLQDAQDGLEFLDRIVERFFLLSIQFARDLANLAFKQLLRVPGSCNGRLQFARGLVMETLGRSGIVPNWVSKLRDRQEVVTLVGNTGGQYPIEILHVEDPPVLTLEGNDSARLEMDRVRHGPAALLWIGG